jgi:hypothetical protein
MTSRVQAQAMTPTTDLHPTLDAFVERYMEMWNEPDPAKRRASIDAMWAPDAANYTETMEAVGLDAIDARVTRAYEAYVGTGLHRFRPHRPHLSHHGAVRVWWEMVTVADGQVAAVGQEFLVLDGDGRIRSDHQFPVPP